MTTDQITVPRELLRQAFDYLNCAKDGEWDGDTVAGREMLDKLRAALEQPAVKPYGHVTVRRLSQRFENHVDQYQFYPAGHVPYTDNVDECIAVYTAPQAQQPAPVQECKHCTKFFSAYRCNASQGECDCPKCQGFCTCSQQPEVAK